MARALVISWRALVLFLGLIGTMASAQTLPTSITDIVHTAFRAGGPTDPGYFGALGATSSTQVVVNYNNDVQLIIDRGRFISSIYFDWYSLYRAKMNRSQVCDPVEASLGVCRPSMRDGLVFVSFKSVVISGAPTSGGTNVNEYRRTSAGAEFTHFAWYNTSNSGTAWANNLVNWPFYTEQLFPLVDFKAATSPANTATKVWMSRDQYRDTLIQYAIAGFNAWLSDGDRTLADLKAAGMQVAGVADGSVIPEGNGISPDGSPSASPLPGTGGSGGGTTNNTYNTNIECTKPDGTKTTNQFECAPGDAETKCSVLDIPCNLKKLFIPSPDFLTDLFSVQNVTQTLELPFVISDTWSFTILGQTVNLNWADFALPPEAVNVVKGLMWFGVFFWLLDFFGIPNPYGNARGSEQLTRDTKHAVARYNASQRRRSKKP